MYSLGACRESTDLTGTPFIRTIQFSDRHPIELPSEGVLALVGANNVGKTYFLKLLRSYIHGTTVEEVSPNGDIFDNIELGWRGTQEDVVLLAKKRVESAFIRTEHGFRCNNRLSYAGGSIAKESHIQTLRSQTGFLGVFSDLFVEFDDAIARVHETDLKQQVDPQNNREKTSLTQSAFENEQASERIKNYFHRIFHKEISYYERHGNIGFVLAPELQSASSAGRALSQSTKNHMDDSPKLWHQGLGMRSALGLLLKIFAADKEIIIVDEPEAFLHPPQAAGLGNVLSEIAVSENKQIILATHDRNLLNGLLKGGDSRVSIQHISRSEESSWIKSIEPATLSKVRTRSLIRYSTIFDSLFVRMTVLVENEKDAYFYSEMIEHVLTKDPASYPNISIDDILFISTSGKGALQKTAELLVSLGSKVVVACDLDLLAQRDQFIGVVETVSGQSETEGLMSTYEDILTELSLTKASTQKQRDEEFKKCRGLSSKSEKLKNSFVTLFEKLDPLKVILHPFGELEDFARNLVNVNGKAEWAQTAIQDGIHQSDEAQTFGSRIVAHLLT